MYRDPDSDEYRAIRREPLRFNMTFGVLCDGILSWIPDMNNDTGDWPSNMFIKGKAGNDVINCVGSIDEPQFYRIKYSDQSEHRFRYRNSDICVTRDQTCDCHEDCPENDNGETACVWINNGRATFCNRNNFRCRNGEIITGTA
ncbi:unnamed protein product [Rotaria socialis]|uniref:Uncharacterized protein n=2 Tax=Rotaria socialis TaxID=392032 RepID=A0A821T9I1_9BILA|nr:unnamed protein product [Rotaria socialis]CAF4869331.1 unnamed protein product [Rotaria socialis]